MTIEDLIKEAKREVKMRESVYPKWVDSGRLAAKTAERQLAAQQETVKVLETVHDMLRHKEREAKLVAYRYLETLKPRPPKVEQPEFFPDETRKGYGNE